eukprot:8400555-Pyramimonas_sp.AAC.1
MRGQDTSAAAFSRRPSTLRAPSQSGAEGAPSRPASRSPRRRLPLHLPAPDRASRRGDDPRLASEPLESVGDRR